METHIQIPGMIERAPAKLPELQPVFMITNHLIKCLFGLHDIYCSEFCCFCTLSRIVFYLS